MMVNYGDKSDYKIPKLPIASSNIHMSLSMMVNYGEYVIIRYQSYR